MRVMLSLAIRTTQQRGDRPRDHAQHGSTLSETRDRRGHSPPTTAGRPLDDVIQDGQRIGAVLAGTRQIICRPGPNVRQSAIRSNSDACVATMNVCKGSARADCIGQSSASFGHSTTAPRSLTIGVRAPPRSDIWTRIESFYRRSE
jgi:hypothetical protein